MLFMYKIANSDLSNNTRAAPKVMPHIYLHGNCNRYKEHNNTI